MVHLTGMGHKAAAALADTDDMDLSLRAPQRAPVLSGFGPGVMVSTNEGPQPVEWLRAGDLVQTRDNGYQPLRWVGRSPLGAIGTHGPIKIFAGAIEENVPEHDLTLSPSHQIMVRSPLLDLLFAEHEVFVPVEEIAFEAEKADPPHASEYSLCHLLFDQHEVVLAEGVWLESLYVDRDLLWLLSERDAEEIQDILGPRIDEMEWARLPLTSDEICLVQAREIVASKRMVA